MLRVSMRVFYDRRQFHKLCLHVQLNSHAFLLQFAHLLCIEDPGRTLSYAPPST